MTYFEAVGQAQLDAAEGQQQIARAFARWVGRVVTALLETRVNNSALHW